MYLSQFSLTLIYFSPLLFALTRTFFKAALSPHFHWDFSYWLFLCTNWPNSLLLFHLFLLFFLPHASYQVTINTSTQALTFVHGIRQKGWIQFFSSLGRMSLCFLQPIFLLPSMCPTHLMSSLIKRHGWQMVGLKTLEISSLNGENTLCYGYMFLSSHS